MLYSVIVQYQTAPRPHIVRLHSLFLLKIKASGSDPSKLSIKGPDKSSANHLSD